MAGKAKLVGTAVKLGAKYGPQVWVATKALQPVAKEAAERVMTAQRARNAAAAHAKTLVQGSILKAFDGDRVIWVVFTGDEAIASHPALDEDTMTRILLRADLNTRIHTSDRVSKGDLAKDAVTNALRRK